MENIMLNDILNISKFKLNEYKMKFCNVSCMDKISLDIYEKSFCDLLDQIAWKNIKDDLSREYVIAWVKKYIDDMEQWIFVGTYKVSKKSNYSEIQYDVGYDLQPIEEHIKYIGRLIIKINSKSNQMVRQAENIMDNMIVVEILNEQNVFNQYALEFMRLKEIITNNSNLDEDGNIDQLYMLFDNNKGSKFIGATYAKDGKYQGFKGIYDCT